MLRLLLLFTLTNLSTQLSAQLPYRDLEDLGILCKKENLDGVKVF
jgi:hypothetical protein